MKKCLTITLCMLLVLLGCLSAHAVDQRVVKVGAFNYYPGIFKDSDGVIKGFYVDALTAIAERENVRFEYVYGSWSEGLERIKTGEVDVLTSVAVTEERSAFLDFTATPLLTVWGELYAPHDSKLDSIRDVEGKKIAVMKSDVNGRNFIDLAQRFGITCDYVELTDFEAVFRAVAAKKVDAGVVNSTFGVAKVKEYGLRSTGVVFNPFDIFFAVSKGKNQDLLALLESYLTSWRHQADSPFHIARQKWSHGDTGTQKIVPRWVWNSLIALVVSILVAVVFIMLLKRQVQRATAEILQREAELRENETKFRSYIDNSPDGIFVADASGHYLDVNPTATVITGYSREELLQMRILDLIPADSADTARAHFAELLDSGAANGEFNFVHKSGKKLWWSVDAVKLTENRFLGFTKDITERKLAEKELQKKNSEIEQFLYMVSHDLRSPLVTVKTFLGYLEKDLAEGQREQISQDLGYIHGAADRMKLLLDELMDVAQIGRKSSPVTAIPFQELISGAQESLAGQISSVNVKLCVSGSEIILHGDYRRLSQIWQNLLDNAIKYLGGQNSPQIEVGVEGTGKKTIFYVRDNGIGIAPEFHEKIFGVFEQLNRHGDGVGMGLTMVKRIVELYGGKIWVESEGAGSGSCFKFTLPDVV